MADYQSIYEGEQMDELWGKANSAVQGIIVNNVEQQKDAQGKVHLTVSSTWADITGKPAWIGDTKPTYTLAELTGDTTHRVVTDAQITAWNNKVDASALSNYLPKTGGTVSGAITFAGDDTYGIFTSTDNYCSIGTSSKAFYRAYIHNIYGTTIYENGTSLTNKYHPKGGSSSLDFEAADIDASGNIIATGEITAGTASDARFKKHQRRLRNAERVLAGLRPVEFDWNARYHSLGGRSKGHDIGFIAQEVKPLIPSAIGNIYGDYLRLDYTKVTPYLVAGWQEHNSEIDALREQVAYLEDAVAGLLAGASREGRKRPFWRGLRVKIYKLLHQGLRRL